MLTVCSSGWYTNQSNVLLRSTLFQIANLTASDQSSGWYFARSNGYGLFIVVTICVCPSEEKKTVSVRKLFFGLYFFMTLMKSVSNHLSRVSRLVI